MDLKNSLGWASGKTIISGHILFLALTPSNAFVAKLSEEELESLQKGLAASLARWKDNEGEFRQHYAHKLEALKFIVAGNATGLASVIIFLNSGSDKGWLTLLTAKFCFVLFALGTMFVARAYFQLYQWSVNVEIVLREFRNPIEDTRAKECVNFLLEKGNSVGPLVARSIILFTAGCIFAAAGILLR